MSVGDFTLGVIADVVEAADRVNISLGGGAGFSEATYQSALAAELGDCQCEVTRVVYHKLKDGRPVAVGTVRFDIVYYNIVIEVKVYPTKRSSVGMTPQLKSQLCAYKRLLFKNEHLLSVSFYSDRVSVRVMT